MKILFRYVKPHRWLVSLVLILSAINIGFSLVDPIIFGKLVNLANHFAQHRDQYTNEKFFFSFSATPHYGVLALLLASVSVAMVSRIAKAFQDYTVNVIIQKFGAALFTDGLKHSMQLPYQAFEDQRSGETLSILTKARADCEKFISYVINVVFGIVVSVVFVSVYATRLHWSIVPIYIGGASMIAYVTNLLSKKIKVIQKNIVKETTGLAGSTTESLRNIELVKSLGLANQEIERLNATTYKILGLELKKIKYVRSMSFLQGTTVNFVRSAMVVVLMILIFDQEISPGKYFTFLFYSFFLFNPLQELGNVIVAWREAEVSLTNFNRILSMPKEAKPSKPKALGGIETLAFDKVSFKHLTANRNALTEISFSAKVGETIAFVGPSGSGKTTLVKLLVGLYQPLSGEVLYNKHASSAIDLDELREKIGFVTQDTQLFSGTIRENLLFVRPTATDEECMDVLHKAACENLLARANNGLDTVIGEGGVKVSGGEKQRLSIARALLRQPDILVFDEATSSLDSLTEEEINETIKKIAHGEQHITIMIAHRLSTIMHADKIIVLEKGLVIEEGKHEDLLALKGLYYAMWRQQIGERNS